MLTETKIKSLPKKDKSYQVTDGDGLVIEVQPSGNKFWRLRFRFDGKPAIYTIGKYPAISTQQARKMRDDAKALLAQGIDPREVKKQAKAQRIALALAEAEKAFTFDDAFADFCQRDDLPEFDYIGLHGIWSWISDDNRKIFVDFNRRKLAVGGVLYNS